ncbi:MAG: glycosyltransferase, partial [Candidatus Bathyarchaeia archaeon]
IFGEGSFKHKLKQYLDKLGIKYELKPPQPYKEYINYLSRANLFGLLSEKEAFGQAVNEANAIGVPVVVAKPWGVNFSGRCKTLVVNLEKDDYVIAGEIRDLMKRCTKESRSKVPVWSEVVEAYVKYLYSGQ